MHHSHATNLGTFDDRGTKVWYDFNLESSTSFDDVQFELRNWYIKTKHIFLYPSDRKF